VRETKKESRVRDKEGVIFERQRRKESRGNPRDKDETCER